MITFVNTVLVSNLKAENIATAAPAACDSMNAVSADYGKFVIMDMDKGTFVTAAEAKKADRIKIGLVTNKNTVRRGPKDIKYLPIIKWSNVIAMDAIKSVNASVYPTGDAETEDTVTIDFSKIDATTLAKFAEGGKRLIVRLTFKDLPTRYRKWTESYEYVTEVDDTAETIAKNIANMINAQWKRARVQASDAAGVVTLVALPYDDDDASNTINWAAKVRFTVNTYYTDPAADGWESKNKHFPKGVVISKTEGKQYPAMGKLVRDEESKAMGYQGILNQGCCTWPIIRPELEAQNDGKYNMLTIEFRTPYRAADDITRYTQQTLNVYAQGGIAALAGIFGVTPEALTDAKP